MRSTIRISKEEYDQLREFRFKQLFCQPKTAIFSSRDEENVRLKKSLIDMKKQFDEKDETISAKKKTIDFLLEQDDKKNKEIEKLKEGIKWRDDGIKDLEDEIDKKNEEIERLKGVVENRRETIKRMSQQLTEYDLFDKKMKTAELTGDANWDSMVERMCRLESKFEAQENPYFF